MYSWPVRGVPIGRPLATSHSKICGPLLAAKVRPSALKVRASTQEGWPASGPPSGRPFERSQRRTAPFEQAHQSCWPPSTQSVVASVWPSALTAIVDWAGRVDRNNDRCTHRPAGRSFPPPDLQLHAAAVHPLPLEPAAADRCQRRPIRTECQPVDAVGVPPKRKLSRCGLARRTARSPLRDSKVSAIRPASWASSRARSGCSRARLVACAASSRD